VLRLVIGDVLRRVGLGVAIGLLLALVAARSLGSFLSETRPADPVALAAAVGLLVFAGVASATLPALRATRIDPVAALRCE
jgi:predicted lysophospholipase L1 biosynthesis ABC-type transport system permease subunit